MVRNLIQDVAREGVLESTVDRQVFRDSKILIKDLDGHIDAAKVEENLCADTVREIVGHQVQLRAVGSSLKAMTESLLPPTLSPETRKSLSLVLSIVAAGSTEFRGMWPIRYPGLDRLGSAILHIYRIVDSLGLRVPWLKELWQSEVTSAKVSCLKEILRDLHPDTPRGEVRTGLERAIGKIAQVAPKDIFSRDKLQPWLNLIPEDNPEDSIESTLHNEKARKSDFPLMVQELRAALSGLQLRETVWSGNVISSDGAIAHGYEQLIGRIHNSLNILQNANAVKLYDSVSMVRGPVPPSTAVIMKRLGIGRKQAQALEQVMTVSYFPAIANLGLRFRYLLMPASRVELGAAGLFEKMSVASHSHKLMQGFVEPVGSSGPKHRLPSGTLDFAVDSFSVSMRAALFDQKSGSWKEPWDTPIGAAVAPPLRFEPVEKKRPVVLTARETEVLGLLWGMHGNHRRRDETLSSGLIPRRTRTHAVQRLLQKRAFMVIHHPGLEYIGLPEGVVIAAKGLRRRGLEEMTRWLTGIFPYLEIHVGDTGDGVWTARVPGLRQAGAREFVKEKLADTGAEYVICHIREQKTYKLSALSRIHDQDTYTWIDPWTRS